MHQLPVNKAHMHFGLASDLSIIQSIPFYWAPNCARNKCSLPPPLLPTSWWGRKREGKKDVQGEQVSIPSS